MRPTFLRKTLAGLAAWTCSLAVACTVTAQVPAPPDPARQILVLLKVGPEHFRPEAQYGGGYGEGGGHSARRRLAGKLASANGLTLNGDWPMPLLGLDCFIMTAPAAESPEVAAARLSKDPRVAWAQPMHLYRAQGAGRSENAPPDDPLFGAQPAARAWRLADLHQIATGRGEIGRAHV